MGVEARPLGGGVPGGDAERGHDLAVAQPGEFVLGVDGALDLADTLPQREHQVAEVSERGVPLAALVTARRVVTVHRVEASQRHGQRVLGDGQPRRQLLKCYAPAAVFHAATSPAVSTRS